MPKRATEQKPSLFDIPADPPTAPAQVSTALKQQTATKRTVDGWLDDLVGALFDPIIVYPAGGWENDLPKPLLDRLQMDRLAHNMQVVSGKEPAEEVCNTEALLYMYPRTMVAPMSEQWFRIYMYLGTKVMGEAMPDDIKHDTLSDYDMSQLRDLKRWIHVKKIAARKAKAKAQKATADPDTTTSPIMASLFDLENDSPPPSK